MATNDDQGQAGARRFAYLDELHLGGIERQLAAGEYVDGSELAAALRRHELRPIPPKVLDYVCRLLEGKVPKPNGRKPLPRVEVDRGDMIIRGLYRIYLSRLKERTQLYGRPAGWTKLDGTAAEIAARIVAKRFLYGPESWRTVQNIASSRK